MSTYDDIQTASWPLLLGVAGVLLAVAGASIAGRDAFSAAVLGLTGVLLVAVAWVFRRLRVTVGDREVRVAFGPGWPRRVVLLEEIVSAAGVRNAWWHGWGIHMVAPGTWLWNVTGRASVELKLASGAALRVGTRDPEALVAAIDAARR